MNFDPNYQTRTIIIALVMIMFGSLVIVVIFAAVQCYNRKRYYKQSAEALPRHVSRVATPAPVASVQIGTLFSL